MTAHAALSKPARWPGAAPSQPCADRAAYLDAMRRVAAAVTVVTTDGPAGRHGATVSAFCSVSADPPTVLVCLRSDSRIREMVVRNGVFTVNVLPEGGSGIARIFAAAPDPVRPDRFAGLGLSAQSDLAPAIEGATSFACHLLRTRTEASHTLCIGLVAEAVASPGAPLTYHDGRYRLLGDTDTQA